MSRYREFYRSLVGRDVSDWGRSGEHISFLGGIIDKGEELSHCPSHEMSITYGASILVDRPGGAINYGERALG